VSQPPSDPGLPSPPPAERQGVGIPLPYSVPVVTYSILAITILVYVAQVASVAIYGRVYHGIDWIELYGARINELIRAGQVWRFLTPALLHASPVHIFFNMYALYSLGTGLERYFGHWRFLSLYLLSAFSGNVLSFLLAKDSSFSVGASTAVFGLIAAEAVFLYQNRRLLGAQARRAMSNIAFLVVVNLLLGLAPGIDMYGHIGGLLGGVTFAWFAGPRWEVEGVYPVFRLVDEREWREVLFGAGLVLLLFGILAAWGMMGGSLG
jgi:rhomboid protease GluP